MWDTILSNFMFHGFQQQPMFFFPLKVNLKVPLRIAQTLLKKLGEFFLVNMVDCYADPFKNLQCSMLTTVNSYRFL